MESTIRKWGNSPALRLPVAAIKEAAFSLEQKVNLTISRGRIVIEYYSQEELSRLVEQIKGGAA